MGSIQPITVFFVVLGTVIALGVTIAVSRPAVVAAATVRRAETNHLPLATPEIAGAVAARLRLFALVGGGTAVVAGLIATAVALGPIGEDFGFVVWVIPFIAIAVAAAVTVVTVSRPLFSPSPGAPRVARAAIRRIGDYLGPLRRTLPRVLAGAAVVAAVVALVRGGATVYGVALVVVAVVGVAALPWIDRAVLAAPQAASDPLELAWDDAFRADACGMIRVTLCLVALTGGVQVFETLPSWTYSSLNFGLFVVVAIYARDRLRAVLFGPWLAVGSTGRR